MKEDRTKQTPAGVDRRQFLKSTGLTLAAAQALSPFVLSGCGSSGGGRRRSASERQYHQGRHPALADRDDGDQRNVPQGRGADGHRRDQREGRRPRQEDRSHRRGPGVQVHRCLPGEGEEAAAEGQGAGRVRLLDLGEPQERAAGVRGEQRPALLPRPVRGQRVARKTSSTPARRRISRFCRPSSG